MAPYSGQKLIRPVNSGNRPSKPHQRAFPSSANSSASSRMPPAMRSRLSMGPILCFMAKSFCFIRPCSVTPPVAQPLDECQNKRLHAGLQWHHHLCGGHLFIEGQAMKTDLQLKADVTAELAWDPAVNSAGIGVLVHDGVVTLTGHLDTFAEKVAAERAVRRVAGVRGLAIELDVKLVAAHHRS